MTETYSVSSDFGGTDPNLPQLDSEINADGTITTSLNGSSLTGDVVEIYFVSTISGAEKTALDAIVAAHTPDATFNQDVKGTITVADGSGGNLTLTPGANNEILLVDSTVATGVQYKSPLPTAYITGMTLNRNSVSVVRVDAGSARDSTDTTNIVLSTNQITNITNSGAGGLDTGSESASTWYAIHAIGDSTGSNPGTSMFSLSPTAPTMPNGYDVFRHVGWVYNNSDSNFYDWDQTGQGMSRRIHYDETFASVRVLNGGSATTRTDVDCSAFVPPDSDYITVRVDFSTGSSGASSDFARVLRKGFDTVGSIQLKPGNVSDQPTSWVFGIPCNNNQIIQYLVSDGTNNSCSIGVVAFEYHV
jgi:hypothetical protein